MKNSVSKRIKVDWTGDSSGVYVLGVCSGFIFMAAQKLAQESLPLVGFCLSLCYVSVRDATRYRSTEVSCWYFG